MGVQTYYVIQVHHRLDAAEARAAEATASNGPSVEADQTPAGPHGALAPADPLAQLDEAEARMRTLFDEFYDRFDRDLGASWYDRPPLIADGDSFFFGDMGQLGPRVDLQDRGDHYELTVDVPGSDEANVEVRVEDDMLVVEGSRESTTEESEPGSYVRRERQFGHFERRLALPNDADASTLQTELENGVLKATLQKKS
jgi:HSP20 family protein